MKAEVPNLLQVFRGQGIYISGCREVLKEYKNELRKHCKRSIIHYYLSGKSAVPLNLIFRISENNPKIIEECSNHMTRFSSRANKPHKVPKEISFNLAYLIGCLRDGYLDPYRYSISITQKKSAIGWIKILSNIFCDEFEIQPRIRKFRDCFELTVNSKPITIFFKEIIGMPSNQEYWETPNIIKNNRHLWVPYISGFFDAEGHCTKPATFFKTGKKKICMHQNNRESLEFIRSVFDEMGIKSTICLQRDRKCHALYIQSREGIEKFERNFKPLLKGNELRTIRSIAMGTPKLVPLEMCHSSASPETGEGV